MPRQKINNAKSSITFSKKTPLDINESSKRIFGISKEGEWASTWIYRVFQKKKKDLFTSLVDKIRQLLLAGQLNFYPKQEN